MRVNIKPLSVNEAWKGHRFKTDKYKRYQRDVMLMLRPMQIPAAPAKLAISITVGYSNAQADVDNVAKPFIDILQKKYGFNDSRIYRLTLVKEVVKKGEEFIEFEIDKLE